MTQICREMKKLLKHINLREKLSALPLTVQIDKFLHCQTDWQCRNLSICTAKLTEILWQCRNLSICTATGSADSATLYYMSKDKKTIYQKQFHDSFHFDINALNRLLVMSCVLQSIKKSMSYNANGWKCLLVIHLQ